MESGEREAGLWELKGKGTWFCSSRFWKWPFLSKHWPGMAASQRAGAAPHPVSNHSLHPSFPV